MHQPIPPTAIVGTPPLIKRNTVLIALSQSFAGAGVPLAYGIGPLMVIALTDSATLSGLFVGVFGLSRFLVSYPIGKITDHYGRKPGIQLGLVLALIGALAVGFAMPLRSFPLLAVGMTIFGMGMAAAQQMRVAVTDMYPPQRRAQALGYMSLGSLAGLIMSPLLVNIAEAVAPGLGRDPLGLPWLLLPAMIVFGMVLVTFVRPDPKQIGMQLEHYFPGYMPPVRATGARNTDFSTVSLLRNVPIRLAIVANCAAQGNMAVVMVLTSLVLSHHHHSLGAIAFSHMFHTAGMFGFTVPLGRMADRIGREKVMYPGVATALLGAVLVTFTPNFFTVTLGTFLVGIGWAAANVAATAMIADHVTTTERGRAIGVNDSFAGGMNVAAALIIGPIVQWSGLPAAGIVAMAFAAVPLVMRLTTRTQ